MEWIATDQTLRLAVFSAAVTAHLLLLLEFLVVFELFQHIVLSGVFEGILFETILG